MTPLVKRLLIAGGAVLGVLIVVYLGAAFASGSTAAPGTTVEGVDIGNMTEEQAAAAVEEAIGPLASKRIKATALDQTFTVKPASWGLILNAQASVSPAFGRKWNPFDLIGALLSDQELPAVVSVDRPTLDLQLDAMAQSLDLPPVEPAVTVEGGEASVSPGIAGLAFDRDAAASALTDALLKPRRAIQLTVSAVDPSVTESEAQEAVELTHAAVAAPVFVQAESVTATIPGDAVGRALSFTIQDGELVPVLDGAVLHRSVRKELKPIEIKGRDATFKIRKGKPKVVRSKVGHGVSDEELAAAVGEVLALPAAERRVSVAVGVREPKITTEQAKTLGIKERLSSFTQAYPYAAYRTQNIGQAAERINGTLLMPGEVFSLNDTLKERTEKNGYTEGFVVGEGGVFAEALGGGVSTSATTAWTAAFYAGMERVQTVAHSIYISRYTAGLEATVAWGIFDMKFRNDTPNGVFITSSTTPTSITVSLWGTKQYDVEAEFGERTNVVPYTKVYDQSEDCLGQNGVDGFTITVDRVFYVAGEEVRREPITTRYKPAPDVTCGKKPDKKPPKQPDVPTDEPTGAVPSATPSGPAVVEPAPSGAPASNAPAGDAPASAVAPAPSPSPTKKPKGQ